MDHQAHHGCCAGHAHNGHRHASSTHLPPAHGQGPGVRDGGRPAHGEAPPRARWPHLPFLLAPAAGPSSRPTLSATSARRRRHRRRPRTRSTPARCTPRCARSGPGSCPICGMALEPAGRDGRGRAQPRARRHDPAASGSAWCLTLPVVALEMGGHLTNLHMLLGQQTSNWLQLLLATPVVLWAGWPFFERGWASLKSRNLNMFTLIALGTGVAWVYSVVATVAPGLFPAGFRGPDGAVAVYFEAAAVITVLVLLGQVLELRAREQTSGAIKALLDLAPKTARRLREDGSDEEVTLDLVLRRRPAAGAAGRPGAGRRRGRRRGERRRREHGHRRGAAGREAAGCQGDRRHAQRPRQLRHARGEGRQGDDARPHRPDGGRGAALAGADPAAGRPGRRLVRAGGRRDRRARVRRLVAVGPGALASPTA